MMSVVCREGGAVASMAERETFDRILIDPSWADLAAALREALRAANEGNDSKSKHIKEWPPPDWAQFLQHLDAAPEGLHGWHGGKKKKYFAGKSQTTVVWWTNALGEKHVRVLGGHGLTTSARLRIGDTGLYALGPPLSSAELLYTERTARVSRPGGVESLVGVCDCGAAGSFAALGWVGPCCAPCHDHRMDGNAAPPVSWHAAGVKYGPHGIHRLTSLAFDPDGGSLLFVYDRLWRWTFATGAVEAVPLPPGVASCWEVTFRPAGKRAVLFGRCAKAAERCVVGWEPGAAIALSEWHLPDNDRTALCLAPDGETVAVSHRERANTKPKLRIRSVHDGSVVRELGAAVGHLKFRPDGELLLLAEPEGGTKLLDAQTGDLIHEFPSVRQIERAFHPNNRDIYASSDTATAGVTDLGAGMRLHVVRYPEGLSLHPVTHFLTVSPDGAALVAGIWGSLYFWELVDGKVGEVWRFEASPERFERCAWSPDGRWLATADRAGTIRLWPWPAVYAAARTAGPS